MNTKTSEREQQRVPDKTKSRLVRGLAGTTGLRVAGLALAFVTNILLGRLMGVSEYGLLTYIASWVGLLSVVGIFGLNRLLVREVATYRLQKAWGLLRGLLRWSHITAFLITIGLVLLAFEICPHIKTSMGAGLASALIPAAFFLIFIVMTRVTGAALLGFQRIISSQFAEMLLQPALCLILIGTVVLISNQGLTAVQTLKIQALAAACACIFCLWQLRRALPAEMRTDRTPACYESKIWLIAAFPLFVVGALDVLNGQISALLLGTLSGKAALGMYAAADRGAQLVILPLTIVNLTLAPTFVNLYQAEQYASLQQLVTRSARLIFFASAPIALALILGGHWFLQLFGHGFTGGQIPLAILCLGQFINAVIGPVGFLLIMTGHGTEAAKGITVGVIVNTVLSAVFIPIWSANGAAAASAAGLVIWNVVLAIFVWKRLSIKTTLFGRSNAK